MTHRLTRHRHGRRSTWPTALGSTRLADAMLSLIFLYAGWDVATTPDDVVDDADYLLRYLDPVLDALGVEKVWVVRVNALAQVLAGAALFAGRRSRLSSAVLFASLVPTNVAGHAFWSESSDQRIPETKAFLTNLAVLGGLLAAARAPRAR